MNGDFDNLYIVTSSRCISEVEFYRFVFLGLIELCVSWILNSSHYLLLFNFKHGLQTQHVYYQKYVSLVRGICCGMVFISFIDLSYTIICDVWCINMDTDQTDSSTSIHQLPDDCLRLIFEKLLVKTYRDSFGLTCRHWLLIQNSSRRCLEFEDSFTHLCDESLSQPLTRNLSYNLDRLLNRFQHLRTLSLSCCTDLTDSGLRKLLDYGLQLRNLSLDCCSGLTDHGFSLVAHGCPSLISVSLYRCNITDAGLEALSQYCLAIENVDVSSCLLISDNGIKALVQNCRHIQYMNISHCPNVCGIGFQGCSQNMDNLKADSCKLEPEGIRSIISGGGLEYLRLSNLNWCIPGHVLASIGTAYLAKLQVLDLRQCRTIDNAAIVNIARGCPLLNQWNLALCDEISLEGWHSIGSNCHNLEWLHVNRCRNLCDQGLQSLRDGCRRLIRLYLSGCSRVSRTAIEMFKSLRSNVISNEEIAPTEYCSCSIETRLSP